jgi:hypothetical protein
MFPILRHIVITDFNAVLCRCLIFHIFLFFLQYIKCTETPLHIEFNEIIFPTSHHMHETGSEQESCANFTPAIQCVQGWFQTAQRSMVLPYLIVRVLKIDDSWCVGKKVWSFLWILNFLLLYIFEHVLKSWWKQQLPSQAL